MDFAVTEKEMQTAEIGRLGAMEGWGCTSFRTSFLWRSNRHNVIESVNIGVACRTRIQL